MEDTVPAQSFSVIHHYSLQILASVSSHFNFLKNFFVQAENFAAPTFRGSKHENKSSLLLHTTENKLQMNLDQPKRIVWS